MDPGSQATGNRFASALSTRPVLADAIREACDEIASSLGATPNAVVVFATHEYAGSWHELPSTIVDRLGTDRLLGCSAEGVIGRGREIESGPGLSLWAGILPQLELTPVHLDFERTPEGGAIVGWPDSLIGDWSADGTLLLLADPFTFPIDYLLQQVNEEHPQFPVVGGMASGASSVGDIRLFQGRETKVTGAVGWMMRRGVEVRSIVSQGCRPVGQTFVVTAAEGNLIKQLGGRPALEQLQRVYAELPTHEQELVQRGLHVGRVVSEYLSEFQMGDFLIRNVLGIDRETSAIAVGDFFRPGQTVQFHLRDEQSAATEFRQLLRPHAETKDTRAALLFSCNGRGTRLFAEADHDAQMVASQLGDIPVAGFFAQGEVGPVGHANFLHGFTASLALFK